MARTRYRVDADAGSPQVLLWMPRLRKSAKKLARTAARFAAVGDVTLTCLVVVKVALALQLSATAMGSSVLNSRAAHTSQYGLVPNESRRRAGRRSSYKSATRNRT